MINYLYLLLLIIFLYLLTSLYFLGARITLIKIPIAAILIYFFYISFFYRNITFKSHIPSKSVVVEIVNSSRANNIYDKYSEQPLYWVEVPVITYPYDLEDIGLVGDVILEIDLKEGVIVDARVKETSGYDVLDNIALRSIYSGKMNNVTKTVEVEFSFEPER